MTAIVTIPININTLIVMMISISSIFIFIFGGAFIAVSSIGYRNYKYIAFGIVLLGIFVIEMLWLAGIIGFKLV